MSDEKDVSRNDEPPRSGNINRVAPQADGGDKETLLIRALLRRHREAGGDLSMTDHQWQRLLFRLRREKLLGSRRPLALYALAASVGVAAVGLALLRPLWAPDALAPTEEASQMRGGDASVRLVAPDPAALADRVEALLKRHAIVPRRVDEPDAAHLQARVPVEATAARQELLALGVTVAAHGRLDLWIVRRQ